MTTNDDLPPWDERAIAARLRDNDRCTVCNRTPAETKLEVHAIVRDDEEASNKLGNYVLLCKEHHEKAHQATFAQYGW
jgi:5-methylcytosine-specific restriction endonuclease McrA